MQIKDANQPQVFLHLQPAQPALGEHFLPFDRKDGSPSHSRKPASSWRSKVPPAGLGAILSPLPLTTAGPSWLSCLGEGVPLLWPQPPLSLSTLSHTLSFLVWYTYP